MNNRTLRRIGALWAAAAIVVAIVMTVLSGSPVWFVLALAGMGALGFAGYLIIRAFWE